VVTTQELSWTYPTDENQTVRAVFQRSRPIAEI
jgi:hypothetical protein